MENKFVETVIINTFSQLFMVSVFHHVSDTWLEIHTEIPHPGQISHAFSDHRNFILLVRTVTFSQKIIFNSSYTEENNYFFAVRTNTRFTVQGIELTIVLLSTDIPPVASE